MVEETNSFLAFFYSFVLVSFSLGIVGTIKKHLCLVSK